ncbi:MAG: murein biosynthesis integral membrane protein MurJ [Deltaproteobacteria bacterium]|nr:murein biosynthesis integral membrane protein MurJ [Deltaproteobacteria bacterium]
MAAGILLSRAAGLVRQSVFAFFFGAGDAADVFNAAFRIPNLLQNLFGEGALSASLIPVYARLRAQGDEEEAARVASVVGTLLALALSVLVLGGVLATPLLVDLIAPGFEGEKRAATIRLVQIFFPGAGLLVQSAWCLGILNSHRRFFLSYAAPVVWSGSIVATLVLFGRGHAGYPLAEWAAWGSVAGSALQFLVQLPTVLSVTAGRLRPSLAGKSVHVRQVFRNFGPVALSRGVVQISAYIDEVIATFLPSGAVAALAYAQVLYMLPVSLFGMSVSAAELPEMSSAVGTDEEVGAALRARLDRAAGQIAFFVVPSVMALVALGEPIAALLFQRGRFGASDARYVWTVLAGSAVGLLAATLGRLYSSTFYALRDTRTPLRFAALRVALTSALGYFFALPLPRLLGIQASWGTAGLTVSAGLAGWVEFALLRSALRRRIGKTGIPRGRLVRLGAAAAAGAAAAWALKLSLPSGGSPFLGSAAVLALFGLTYLGASAALGEAGAGALLSRLTGRPRR